LRPAEVGDATERLKFLMDVMAVTLMLTWVLLLPGLAMPVAAHAERPSASIE
jgi:hypothetical protein